MTSIDYDWEFLEDGRHIDPISIGMVSDDGREYYAVNALLASRSRKGRKLRRRIRKNEWLMENVVPHLPQPHGDWRLHMPRRWLFNSPSRSPASTTHSPTPDTTRPSGAGLRTARRRRRDRAPLLPRLHPAAVRPRPPDPRGDRGVRPVTHVQTVAVDFDGVLHSYDKGWHDGSIYGDWIPDADIALTQLMQRYAVFVHTTRKPKQVARWIERQTGYRVECTTWLPRTWYGRRKPFWNTQGLLLVTDRKLAAVAYIDDRAVRFTNWHDALTSVDVEPFFKKEPYS